MEVERLERPFRAYRQQFGKRLRDYEKRLDDCERHIKSLERKIDQAEGEDRTAIRSALNDLQERYDPAKASLERGIEQVECILNEGKEAIETGLASMRHGRTRSANRDRGLLNATRISIMAVRKGVEEGVKAAKEARRIQKERT